MSTASKNLWKLGGRDGLRCSPRAGMERRMKLLLTCVFPGWIIGTECGE
jgi:hypothetical protein